MNHFQPKQKNQHFVSRGSMKIKRKRENKTENSYTFNLMYYSNLASNETWRLSLDKRVSVLPHLK